MTLMLLLQLADINKLLTHPIWPFSGFTLYTIFLLSSLRCCLLPSCHAPY